jgi:hypothetical protein
MSETYKRMFLRWEIIRGWIPAFVFAAIAVSLELLFFNYMVGRGLVDQQVNISPWTFKIPISIALLFSLGNGLVLLTLWMSVFESTAYVMAGPDRQVRRILYPLRMIRGAALVLTPFTIVLFSPYIVESSWFIAGVEAVSNAVPSLKQSAVNFYTWSFGVSRTDASAKFIASQLSAALAAVVASGLQLWRVRGTRNLMLLFRKKK